MTVKVPSSEAPSFPLGGGVSKPSPWVGKDARQTVMPEVTGVQTDQSFLLGQPLVAEGRAGEGLPNIISNGVTLFK
ncbi:unnamed protein product, partial [Gulo gulo]